MYKIVSVVAGIVFSLAAFSPALAAPLELSAPEAHRMAAAGEVLLVDIRTPAEWQQTGVAQDAVLINMLHPQGPAGFAEELLRHVDGDLDAPIAIICRTGNRTTQLQRDLQQRGFTRIYNVREGMAGSAAGPGWLKRGLPLASE